MLPGRSVRFKGDDVSHQRPLEEWEYPDPDDYDDDDDDAETKPCPNCGLDVYEEADRCPHCGEFVTFRETMFAGWSLWFLILGLFGIGAVIVTLAVGL